MNLKQLANALGLSPTTVSRALNGYAEVNEKTRHRVVAAAAELGYKPNFAARRLALQKSETVGIIYPPDADGLGDPHFLEVVGGISERFNQIGIDLLIITTLQKDELSTYARMVQGRRVDALLVARTRVDDPDAGIVLGREVSVIVYDDVPDDNLLPSPAITSIDQPTPQRTGEMLADLMNKVQQHRPVAELQVLWQPVMRAGESDGPPQDA